MARRNAQSRTTTRSRISKGESSAFAYQALRRDIVSLTLPPDALLDEAGLVLRLGLSRTPVREALVRLAGDGLVRLLPNRGARVAALSWNDIREQLEALDVTQRLVTRWAALRRTPSDLIAIRAEVLEFERLYAARDSVGMIECNWRLHAAVADACRNGPIAQFYLRVLTDNLRVSRFAMTYECFADEAGWRAHLDAIVSEHAAMLDAIARQDADRAEALARSHAGLARKRVAETLTHSLVPAMHLALGMDAVETG